MKTRILLVICTAATLASCETDKKSFPRVFVFTDINIGGGDPDDRQSLAHLLWYADELQIEGIVPDRWNAQGYEACELVVDAYAKDHKKHLAGKNYPTPEHIQGLIAVDLEDAIARFTEAASVETSPLYVLVWGNMRRFGAALKASPESAKNIRVVSIGTGLMLEEDNPYLPKGWEKADRPCEQYNWNSHGRNEIYFDDRFKDMWWLEINWTYNGMFVGEEPGEMFHKLSTYGSLGLHIKEVVKNYDWAQYFRVGDTPSVLYVIDPGNQLDDPTFGSWAGKFVKPLPQERPNYYTDANGEVDWNYADPCSTWENHVAFYQHARATLTERRPGVYEALLAKLEDIYRE